MLSSLLKYDLIEILFAASGYTNGNDNIASLQSGIRYVRLRIGDDKTNTTAVNAIERVYKKGSRVSATQFAKSLVFRASDQYDTT